MTAGMRPQVQRKIRAIAPAILCAWLVAAGAVLAGGQDLKTVWNVFGETDRWINTFAPYVRAGDTILIVEGNGGSSAYPPNAIEKLRTLSAALKPLKGKIRFGVYTSDLENVKTVAKGVKGSGFAFIAYGYEPAYGREFPREGDKGWQFEAALENVRRAKGYARGAEKKLMLVSTGRPLLEEELQRYKWDYSRFLTGAGADELLIQTQTWIRRWDFREALDVLDAQLNGREKLRERVILQVTVEPRREANQNGVAAVAGYDATLEARLRGYRTMSLWHAWRDLGSELEYLRLTGRGRRVGGRGREGPKGGSWSGFWRLATARSSLHHAPPARPECRQRCSERGEATMKRDRRNRSVATVV